MSEKNWDIFLCFEEYHFDPLSETKKFISLGAQRRKTFFPQYKGNLLDLAGDKILESQTSQLCVSVSKCFKLLSGGSKTVNILSPTPIWRFCLRAQCAHVPRKKNR